MNAGFELFGSLSLAHDSMVRTNAEVRKSSHGPWNDGKDGIGSLSVA